MGEGGSSTIDRNTPKARKERRLPLLGQPAPVREHFINKLLTLLYFHELCVSTEVFLQETRAEEKPPFSGNTFPTLVRGDGPLPLNDALRAPR